MKFYEIEQKGEIADVYIFGDIADYPSAEYGEVSANSFRAELKGIKAQTIRLHINSYGGSVPEGWAIYNTLLEHPARVVSYADGFVASAALYPFLAGDERHTSELAAFYLHEAQTVAGGYASDLRRAADDLDIITGIGKQAFVTRAGMDAEKVDALMAQETWLDAKQALELGIATVLDKAGDGGGVSQSAQRAILQKIFATAKNPAEPEKQTKEKTENKIKNFFEKMGGMSK